MSHREIWLGNMCQEEMWQGEIRQKETCVNNRIIRNRITIYNYFLTCLFEIDCFFECKIAF